MEPSIRFLKLSTPERTKNLNLAKTVLFSTTNEQLREYRIPDSARKPGGLWQLLNAIKRDGMKNDASLDLFYEVFGEHFQPGYPYAVFLFHGRYDVPVKVPTRNGGRSEEIYRVPDPGTVSPLNRRVRTGRAGVWFSVSGL